MITRLYVGPPMDEPPTMGNLQCMTLVKVDDLQGFINERAAQQRRFLAHFRTDPMDVRLPMDAR